MKASELRIGNYVYAFKTNYTIDETDFIGEKITTYKPIPLTKEILLKCGFYYNAKTKCYHYNDFILDKHLVMMDIDITVKLKSLHQLQNLYFALTNEELKINL